MDISSGRIAELLGLLFVPVLGHGRSLVTPYVSQVDLMHRIDHDIERVTVVSRPSAYDVSTLSSGPRRLFGRLDDRPLS